jgi:hypothetical protein
MAFTGNFWTFWRNPYFPQAHPGSWLPAPQDDRQSRAQNLALDRGMGVDDPGTQFNQALNFFPRNYP